MEPRTEPAPLTEAQLAARRAENEAASREAERQAAEQRARNAAEGLTPDQIIAREAASSLKDKLFGEQFGDPATLRPREGVSEQQ